VIPRNWTDTGCVVAETVRLLTPAWLLRHVTVTAGVPSTSIDTLVESGDTLMRRIVPVGDLTVWPNSYRVPFAVGAHWRLGAAGTYYTDLNGDSLEDTLVIWQDSARIVAREDVTVPQGTVPGCWRIVRVARAAKSWMASGVATRETADLRFTEWYKDSLWWVKESTYVTGSTWQLVSLWVKVGEYVRTGTKQLTSLVGIAESDASGVGHGTALASPNPFVGSVAVGWPATAGDVLVSDAGGRVIRRLRAGGPVVWDGRDRWGRTVPAGVYALSGGGRVALVTRAR
jgi:hypothetical protein